MTHKTQLIPGSDPRNWKVKCSCGWAFSTTQKGCNQMRMFHTREDSPYRWDDPRRVNLPDTRWYCAA